MQIINLFLSLRECQFYLTYSKPFKICVDSL